MELQETFVVDPELIEHLTDALLSVIPGISLQKKKDEIMKEVEKMMIAKITSCEFDLRRFDEDQLRVISIALKYYKKES